MPGAPPRTAGFTLICTDTIQGSDGIGTVGAVNMTRSPLFATQTELTVPSNQSWQIWDIYITAAAGAGTSEPVVKILKNLDAEMILTPNLGALLVSNNSRPKFSLMDIGFEPVSLMSMLIETTVANDTADDNIAFRVAIAVS